MKNEITNIRLVYKFGAYGKSDAFARWIYGKRPDGKTVACENKDTKEGGILIWSYWKSPECGVNEVDVCETEFTAEEWKRITSAPKEHQSRICNEILWSRKSRN